MKKIKLEVNTRLTVTDYFNVVEELAFNYFDVNGEYQPHLGSVNSIRTFYNYCVIHSALDGIVEHDFIGILDVEKIRQDKDIMAAFDDALSDGINDLNFARAYCDAQAIVEHKKSSISSVTEQIGGYLEKLVGRINEVVNREDLDKIVNIAKHFAEYGIDADAVMKAYEKSDKFNNDLINLDERRKQKQEEQKE